MAIRRPQVLALLIICVATRPVLGQQRPSTRFADFPVADQFTGRPASVILTPGEEHQAPYGSFKALLVSEAARGANFAGHFRLITESCGTSCANVVIVDETTGRTFGGPGAICGESHRLSSDLLVVNPLTQSGQVSGPCPDGPEYYRWVGQRFIRLDLTDEPGACKTSLVSAAGPDTVQLLRQYLASLPEEYPASVWCAAAFALVRFKATPSAQNDSAFAMVHAFGGRVLATYHPTVDSTTSSGDVATLQAAIHPYGLQLKRQGLSYQVSEISGWLGELFAGRLTKPDAR